MDEALAFCAVDISGRPFLRYDARFQNPSVGAYDTCLTLEFMRALAANARLTVHLRLEYGENDHHATEALYKACARALRQAAAIRGTELPSTKKLL
jgi:imidazoleglycerol-phosphate dehydratase